MQAWQLAKHLIARGHAVELLTTCSRSFEDDWSVNTHRPGLAVEDRIPVRRFRVDRRDRAAFARADHALLTTPRSSLKIGVNPVSDEDARAFATEGIKSSALLDYLARSSDRYASFLFLQYLYGPTLQGLPLVADRAFLQPTLHDEPYAYIPAVADVFARARGLLFISVGEFELAQRLYGPGIIAKSRVAGAGIDPFVETGTVRSIREFDPRCERFVLYLGRQEPAKNVDMLVESFRTYRGRRPLSKLKLVLAGQPGHAQVNSSNELVNLGRVEDAEKDLLLRCCRALAQPSINESYSRVMVEAWMHGRPVVVHADCVATAAPALESGGGWVASGVDDWSRVFEKIDEADDAALAAFGERGRVFAEEYGDWEKVIARYEAALGLSDDERPGVLVGAPSHVVAAGDRFGREYADALDRALQFRQDVAGELPGRLIHLSSEAPFPAFESQPGEVIVCHHLNPSPADDRLIERLRGSIGRVVVSTPLARDVVVAAGCPDPAVAPVCVDPREWDILPDRSLISALQDGRVNLVFAGEFAEFDHLGELVEAFLHFLTLERYARLFLVGLNRIDPTVHAKLTRQIESLRLNDDVVVTTGLPPAQQLAVYRTSRLFWTMDGRGDLGRHLLNAMWFDIPILAFRNPTTSFLVEEAGIVFTGKDDLLEIAALAKIMTSDQKLRAALVSAQRHVRARWSVGAALGALSEPQKARVSS